MTSSKLNLAFTATFPVIDIEFNSSVVFLRHILCTPSTLIENIALHVVIVNNVCREQAGVLVGQCKGDKCCYRHMQHKSFANAFGNETQS